MSQPLTPEERQLLDRNGDAYSVELGYALELTYVYAAISIAAIPAESIPFIAVAVLIADTGHELYATCETERDLDQLYVDFGMGDEPAADAMHSVFDLELPTYSAMLR